MKDIKTSIIGLIAVIALFVSFIALGSKSSDFKAGTTNNASTAVTIAAGTTLPNGYITPNPSTFDYIVSRGFLMAQNILGLGNGTSVPTYQQVARMTLNTATTTPCALQNPFNATSTLSDGVIFNITTSTSSAATLTFATSTTAYATTSTFSTQTAGANLQGTYTAAGGNPVVVAPNGWVVIGAAGVGYGFTFGGSCQATFQTAN